MLSKELHGWMVHCDGPGCAESLDVHSADHEFRDVLQALDEAHWVSRRIGLTWEHLCPVCSNQDAG